MARIEGLFEGFTRRGTVLYAGPHSDMIGQLQPRDTTMDMEYPDRREQSPEGKRPWTKPRIKTLRVLSTRAGTVNEPGVDEDNYINDNSDNKYMPIS